MRVAPVTGDGDDEPASTTSSHVEPDGYGPDSYESDGLESGSADGERPGTVGEVTETVPAPGGGDARPVSLLGLRLSEGTAERSITRRSSRARSAASGQRPADRRLSAVSPDRVAPPAPRPTSSPPVPPAARPAGAPLHGSTPPAGPPRQRVTPPASPRQAGALPAGTRPADAVQPSAGAPEQAGQAALEPSPDTAATGPTPPGGGWVPDVTLVPAPAAPPRGAWWESLRQPPAGPALTPPQPASPTDSGDPAVAPSADGPVRDAAPPGAAGSGSETDRDDPSGYTAWLASGAPAPSPHHEAARPDAGSKGPGSDGPGSDGPGPDVLSPDVPRAAAPTVDVPDVRDAGVPSTDGLAKGGVSSAGVPRADEQTPDNRDFATPSPGSPDSEVARPDATPPEVTRSQSATLPPGPRPPAWFGYGQPAPPPPPFPPPGEAAGTEPGPRLPIPVVYTPPAVPRPAAARRPSPPPVPSTPPPVPSTPAGSPARPPAGPRAYGHSPAAGPPVAASPARVAAPAWPDEAPPAAAAGSVEAFAAAWRRGMELAGRGVLAPVPATRVDGRRVLVGGFGGGSGRTTVAVGLGLAMAARRGGRVVAIDACPDQGGPLADRAGVPGRGVGLRELAADRSVASLAEARRFLATVESSGLEVLPGLRDLTGPGLTPAEAAWVVDLLERLFPAVVIDGPPGWTQPVPAVLLARADTVVLTARAEAPAARGRMVRRGPEPGLSEAGCAQDALTALAAARADLPAGAIVVRVQTAPSVGGRHGFLGRAAGGREEPQALTEAVHASVTIPFDPALASQAPVVWKRLRPRTQAAFTLLADLVDEAPLGPVDQAPARPAPGMIAPSGPRPGIDPFDDPTVPRTETARRPRP